MPRLYSLLDLINALQLLSEELFDPESDSSEPNYISEVDLVALWSG